MTDKPQTPPAKPPGAAPDVPAPARPAWTQPKPKPSLASPAAGAATAAGPAKPGPQAPAAQGMAILEDFGTFLAKEIDGLIARMNAEANRLSITQPNRLRVFTMILMNRVAAYGVRGGLAKKDIIDIFESYWAMQPKPTAPVPAPPKR